MNQPRANSRGLTALGILLWRSRGLLAPGYPSRPSRRGNRPADGFSLLEVILALGILAGAIAVLGEVARNSMENARFARDLCVAQLLCESKMDEILTGITLPDPVTDEPFETTDNVILPDWRYSIEVESIDTEQGLSVVRVTVAKDLPNEKRPARFSLTRWIVESSTGASGASSTSTGTLE